MTETTISVVPQREQIAVYEPRQTREVVERQKPEYISVFEDPSRYDSMMKVATCLANSDLVPTDFKKKPCNCLIVLDMAQRLGLKSAMSLFPHMFIIGGKPAFSTQFLIALINNSGKFTRIKWEFGEDGTFHTKQAKNAYGVTCQEKDWPNYWAQASFIERETGETFKSSKISCKLAYENGWFTKSGSKWQTLPVEMCKYRAAAFLIRQTCPELILGLEFAEEVADYDSEPPLDAEFSEAKAETATTEVEPVEIVREEKKDEKFFEFTERAENATSLEEINAVIDEIAKNAAELSDSEKTSLRNACRAKRNELLRVKSEPEKSQDVKKEPDTVEGRIEAATDVDSLIAVCSEFEVGKDGTRVVDDKRLEELRKLAKKKSEAFLPDDDAVEKFLIERFERATDFKTLRDAAGAEASFLMKYLPKERQKNIALAFTKREATLDDEESNRVRDFDQKIKNVKTIDEARGLIVQVTKARDDEKIGAEDAETLLEVLQGTIELLEANE